MPTGRPVPAWRWVPSLYFVQGLPYVVVVILSSVMLKNLGLSNTDVALYTSWLYLPWVIKPLWSPLVDLLGRKRVWIVASQALLGVGLGSVALTLPLASGWQISLGLFWLVALASATHDIAADGFYLLALVPGQQSAWVGVRSTFYRLAMIAGQGGLIYLAGRWQVAGGGDAAAMVRAWQGVMALLAVLLAASAWHAWALPRPVADAPAPQTSLMTGFAQVLVAFFRQPDLGRILAFLLLYRLAEAQLLKLVVPFLLDARGAGGLALSTSEVGLAYGTVGVAALTLGGLAGGWVIARVGLGRALWPLMLCMHGPIVVFVVLARWQPTGLAWVSAALALEQFGYGFGFAAYMVFMLWVASRHDNPHQTAHYALCTGIMALGMMLPGMWAGALQAWLGYPTFFAWMCVAALPSFGAAWAVRIPAEFGRRSDTQQTR